MCLINYGYLLVSTMYLYLILFITNILPTNLGRQTYILLIIFRRSVMKKELGFLIVKPGFKRYEEALEKIYEDLGLKVVKRREMFLTKTQISKLYSHLSEKDFFIGLLNYMSKEVVVYFLEGENAVEKIRKKTGSTDPIIAEEGSVRSIFGKNIEENVIHCPENITESLKEMKNLFSDIPYVAGYIAERS